MCNDLKYFIRYKVCFYSKVCKQINNLPIVFVLCYFCYFGKLFNEKLHHILMLSQRLNKKKSVFFLFFMFFYVFFKKLTFGSKGKKFVVILNVLRNME